MPRILACKNGEFHLFDAPKFLYAYMDLFWSGATPIFTIFLCRMTRMVKIVTRPKTMVNFIFFPPAGKMVKIIFFPPAGKSGRMDRKTAAVSTRYRRRALCAGPMPFHAGKRKTRTRCRQQTDSDFRILVDLIGIEPTTLRMRTVRSPKCDIARARIFAHSYLFKTGLEGMRIIRLSPEMRMIRSPVHGITQAPKIRRKAF